LYELSPDATVFQGFDWAQLWVECYQHCIRQLYVIVCADDTTIVGLVPLYVPRRRFESFAPLRLMFFGTGEPEHEEVCAEYMAPLSLPRYEEQVAKAAADAIVRSSRVRSIEFQRVRQRQVCTLVAELARQWGVGLDSAKVKPLGQTYYMTACSEGALSAMSTSVRGGLRRKWKRLHASGDVRVHLAEDRDSLDCLFAALVELHQKRWEGKKKPGVFASDKFRKFHSALCLRLLEKGQLLLFAVFHDGEPLAVNYCLRSKSSVHYYQGGFDPDRLASLSPGLLAHLYGANLAATLSACRYDLMLESTAGYKQQIGQPGEELVSIALGQSWLAALRRAAGAWFGRRTSLPLCLV
jgi:CelD/BcsL family acetyltransferase involved in cellulose biosynthesis